jgi:predicted transcriptional regulator
VKTVVLEIRSLRETLDDAMRVTKKGRADREAHIAFVSPELLWQVLTGQRWELLKALCGAGPMSIREAARRVDRDVKVLHGDVKALLDAGVLSRNAAGAIEFPFESVKIEFLLRAASRALEIRPEVVAVKVA